MSDKQPQFISHSRMQKFRKCRRLGYYEYYQPNRVRISEQTTPLLYGTIIHRAIELFYEDECKQPALHYLEDAWKEWFDRYGLKPEHWDKMMKAVIPLAGLLKRTLPTYRGPDRIWKDANTPFKEPKKSKAWEREYVAAGLPQLVGALDRELHGLLGPTWRNVEFSDAYIISETILQGYKHPAGFPHVLASEFEFSQREYTIDANTQRRVVASVGNAVVLPGTEDYFTGKADLMVQDDDGNVAILDFKNTMSEPMTRVQVAHHLQLNLYAWAYHQLSGSWPAYIGIFHTFTSELVLAKVSPQMATDFAKMLAEETTIEHILTERTGVEDETAFVKCSPMEYGSPCRSKWGDRDCPYLSRCWPHLLEA